MNRAIKTFLPLLLFLAILTALPDSSLARRKKLIDENGNAIPLKIFGRRTEVLLDNFGPPDRTWADAKYQHMSFFKFGVMVSVHREYDEVDKVVLTTFENGNRFEGMFEGTKLGDHYLSLQARWGFPEARTEQPDQWFDLYQWKIKGHPVVVQVWNRGTDDPSFGYIKEQTVKRIEILRKHERWE